MTQFRTLAIELIKTKDLSKLHSNLKRICFSGSTNNIGKELIEMIIENSNDFTKDISEKWLKQYNDCPCEFENEDGTIAEYTSILSDKQLWCLCYQIKNNINVYIQ